MWRRNGRKAARERPETSWPLIRMLPPVGSISRAMQRATVDLPEPLSPTTPRARPLRTSMETSFAAAPSRARPRAERPGDAAAPLGPARAALARRPEGGPLADLGGDVLRGRDLARAAEERALA